jgi:hypothetical protein
MSVLALAFLMAATASAQSTTISYQGVLRGATGAPVADGTYALSFSIWDASSGGNNLWQEVQSGVQATLGAFSLELGSVTPFGALFSANQATQLWLEVAVDLGAGLQAYGPRATISRAPYAFDADTIDGNHAADLSFPVGAIMPFYLGQTGVPTAAELQAQGWALCNGQTAADQGITGAVFTVATPNINGSGLFIRGGTSAGLVQAESVGPHNHTASFSGSIGSAGDHTHTQGLTAASAGSHAHPQNVSANPNTGGTGHRRDWNEDATGLGIYAQGISTDAAGAHGHSISGSITSGGAHGHTASGTVTVNNNAGTETRPVNISMVFFIKVK